MTGVTFARSTPTDEFHAIQLKDNPNDPDTHSNYGAFLNAKKHDRAGAEKAFRKALTLDPTHGNATVNLAATLALNGEVEEAEKLYRSAILSKKAPEHVYAWFAEFLRAKKRDFDKAEELLRAGTALFPNNLDIQLQRGWLHIDRRAGDLALPEFQGALQGGAPQDVCLEGIALATHLSGAAPDDCISAYRTALALCPSETSLSLNLCQMLFLSGARNEASQKLLAVLSDVTDVSALVEGWFYCLAYRVVPAERAMFELEAIHSRGGRLDWDVSRNILHIRESGEKDRAEALKAVADLLANDEAVLDLRKFRSLH